MSKWTAVGRVEDVPPLGARVVRTPTFDIAIFRVAGDHIFALEDCCPHRGGPLSQGIVHGDRVTCPLHDWCIDLAAGNAVAPDQGSVRTFPVRITDGQIELDLDRVTLRAGAA